MLKINKKKHKILIMAFIFCLNNSFSSEEKKNIENITIATLDEKETLLEIQNKLFLLLQSTLGFMQEKNIDQKEIGEMYNQFLEKNPTLLEIFKKLFSQKQENQIILTHPECVIIFEFIYTLITQTNIKKSLNIKISEIDFSSLENNTLLLEAYKEFEKNIASTLTIIPNKEKNISQKQEFFFDEKTFDNFNDLMIRLTNLLKRILDNINNKNYNKNLIQKITKISFESKQKKSYIDQYQQFFSQITEQCLQGIQENIFHLSTIRLNYHEISIEKQQASAIEILDKTTYIMSFIKYGIENNFIPDNKDIKEFLTFEKKIKKLEDQKNTEEIFKEQKNLIESLQSKIEKGIIKNSKELQNSLIKKGKNQSINDAILFLIELTKIYSEKEQKICFYAFQNAYRFVFTGLENFFDKNVFSRSLKFLINNPVKIFSTYFAWDMYKFLHPSSTPESSYLSMLLSRMIEIYKDINSVNPTPESTSSTMKKAFDIHFEEYLQGGLPSLRREENDLKTKLMAYDDDLRKSEISSERKLTLENLKNEAAKELKELQNKIEIIENDFQSNFNTYNTELLRIKNTINEDNDAFIKELKTGKFANYSNIAKNSYKNKITRKELKDITLLEKKYTEEYLFSENKTVDTLTEDEKNKIKQTAKEIQNVVFAWEEKESKHAKMIHPIINPYPFRNVGNNINQIGSWALPATAGIFGIIVNNYAKKLEGTFLAPIKKVLQNIHFVCMGERPEQTNTEIKKIEEEDFKYNINDKTFDVWRSQGILDWFDAVIKEVKKVYSEAHTTLSSELDRAILVIGESGSGKTTLVNAWLKSLSQEANKSGKLEVEFFAIDPKMFTKEMADESGRLEKVDIFAQCKGYLKSIKFTNKVVVIHIDEAHLLLGTNEGTFSLTRWADLLNFVTSLNDEQRKNRSRGAMFLIASTNRPDILPPEILKNPNRFSNIIEIPLPSYNDRISILKGYLTNLGLQTNHIDFEYLSGLLEGTNQSYGNVLRIIQKAVIFAKINHTMVTTETIYKFINEFIRNITFNINKLDAYCLDQVSSYYSAIAATAIHFETIQNLYMFDMATVYPLKNEIESKNISQLYVYPKVKPIQFGEVFYCKKSFQIEGYSKKNLILNLIENLVGNFYCELTDSGYPKQAQKKLGDAYEKIYEFYASSSPEYAHIASQFITAKKQIDSSQENAFTFNNHLSDVALNKKSIDILKKIEIEIKKFINDKDVKIFIEKIKTILNDKKIITRKEIIENEETKELMSKTKKQFDNLYNSIKNLLI